MAWNLKQAFDSHEFQSSAYKLCWLECPAKSGAKPLCTVRVRVIDSVSADVLSHLRAQVDQSSPAHQDRDRPSLKPFWEWCSRNLREAIRSFRPTASELKNRSKASQLYYLEKLDLRPPELVEDGESGRGC